MSMYYNLGRGKCGVLYTCQLTLLPKYEEITMVSFSLFLIPCSCFAINILTFIQTKRLCAMNFSYFLSFVLLRQQYIKARQPVILQKLSNSKSPYFNNFWESNLAHPSQHCRNMLQVFSSALEPFISKYCYNVGYISAMFY